MVLPDRKRCRDKFMYYRDLHSWAKGNRQVSRG